jgi:2-polyprenyl-3-methyl-5-hydroxy-6-metoxy-1,4-benzoquinol methylase
MHEVLRSTALRYPEPLIDAQLQDVARTAFHVGLVRKSVGRHAAVCEIGGGGGLFSPGCAAMGIKTTLVDDLPVEIQHLHAELGVNVAPRDILFSGGGFAANQFDAVASFDGIRHLHSSPEGFFPRVKSWLRPGGAFILGVPNGARRRSREPRVADLRSLAKSMELRSVRVIGRNWRRSRRRTPLHSCADHLLRLEPSLCADLYLIGYK